MAEARDIAPGSPSSTRYELSRLLTRLESADRDAIELLSTLPAESAGHVVGVTGPPGVGKSTMVNALVVEARRRGRKIAVLAVDPSSDSSGGALLGDRLRMTIHHADPQVYIRSVATRGHLGGASLGARFAVRALARSGFDLVLVETVGVGQSETEIARLASSTVMVVEPGMGDDIQNEKAGLLEVADIFAVNKADLVPTKAAAAALRKSSAASRESMWKPPVLEVSALELSGVAELLDAIDSHWAWTAGRESADPLESDAVKDATALAHHLAQLRVSLNVANSPDLIRRVAAGELAVYEAGEFLARAPQGPENE